MSNILLFFMSSYTPTVENGAYNRAQTNEAVLYELQKKKESRTDMVLALCSDKVRKDPLCAHLGWWRTHHDSDLFSAARPARRQHSG